MDTPKSGQPPYNGHTVHPLPIYCPYISTSETEQWTKCSSPMFRGSIHSFPLTHHFYVPLTTPPFLSVMFVTVGWMKQLQQCLMHYAVCYELVCFSSSPLQARQPGEFFLEKLSVKVGSLDFTISSPSPHGWWAEPLVITKKTEGISISLLPTLGSEPFLLLSSLS